LEIPESVIESVWAVMKRRVELEDPQRQDELEHVVRSVWNKMSPEVIANDGGAIQHP
jgi:hypothetical protein